MSRYEGLTKSLDATLDDEVDLTFEEIDLLIGGLPPSARKHPAWWANSSGASHQARHWLSTGFRAKPDLETETVHFVRSLASGPKRTRKRKTAPKTPSEAKAAVITTRRPVELVPSGDVLRGTLLCEWQSAGELEAPEGRLELPLLEGRAGVYRFTITDQRGLARSFVGETENLSREMHHLRHPEPSQPVVARVHELLVKTLGEGGQVTLEVVVAAIHGGETLDLANGPARRLVESAALCELQRRGRAIENP